VLCEFGAQGGDFQAQPGSRRFYAHAYQFLDLKPGSTVPDVNLTLHPGASVHGRVLGPDGQPVRDAWIFSRVIQQSPPTGGWKHWDICTTRGRGTTYGGHFALHGLGPDPEVPAYFLEADRQWGATARFTAKSAADGPVTIRLEPCGTARARLVGPDAKPLGRYR